MRLIEEKNLMPDIGFETLEKRSLLSNPDIRHPITFHQYETFTKRPFLPDFSVGLKF